MGETNVHVVDLRSDTLTLPDDAMKQAMINSPLGDDAFGEDPTVIALQDKVAKLLGKERSLFVASGTMGNLICVLSHCWERGAEIILGDQSHTHIWEQGGVAQLGGVHPRTLPNNPDGTFSLEELRKAKRGEDAHWPRSKLVCIENTHNVVGGKVLPMAWVDELEKVCKELNLPIHMDGARLLNAAEALNLPPSRLVRGCASVSMCLSKGLGAPVGSVIAGSSLFIQKAYRIRKVLGGGMRQAGVLAGAGIYALDHAKETLAKDHRHAQYLAKAVADIGSTLVKVDLEGVHTNIILLECDTSRLQPEQLCKRMNIVTDKEASDISQKIVVLIFPMTASAVRMVTHCNIKESDVEAAAIKLKYVIQELEKTC